MCMASHRVGLKTNFSKIQFITNLVRNNRIVGENQEIHQVTSYKIFKPRDKN